jgi:hypothetical protein
MNYLIKKNNISLKVAIKIFAVFVVFLTIFTLDSTLAQEKPSNNEINFEIKKDNLAPDSPFRDSQPRIDQGAAEIVKESEGAKNYQILLSENNHCASLPQNIWIILLGAYLFLIIFNLSYEFEKTRKIHWFWESLYTILALLAWYNFDECRKFTWFAPSVIESGIIIYAFYFYFRNNFNKKSPQNVETSNDKQEKLDLK